MRSDLLFTFYDSLNVAPYSNLYTITELDPRGEEVPKCQERKEVYVPQKLDRMVKNMKLAIKIEIV